MNIIKNVPTKFDMSVLGSDGKKVSDLIVAYTLYDDIGTTLTFGTMEEPVTGIYSVTIELEELGQYRLCYTTPIGYEDGMQPFTVVDEPAKEATLAAENDKLARILGMVQENFRAFDHVYDSEGNQISSTAKIYASASDCNSDTSPIATYQVTATYLPGRKLNSYKVVKV